jgi:steroid delta-isomerase-like uncharacterized protein
MSEQANIQAASAFYEAWNAGDLNKMDPYQADNYVSEQPGAAGVLDKERSKMYLQNFLTAFPGSRFEVLRTISQGDYVVQHWKVSGTNSGTLHSPSGAAIPPTGKSVVVTGSTTSEVKNGKIVRQWAYWDLAGLLAQMGLLPPM